MIKIIIKYETTAFVGSARKKHTYFLSRAGESLQRLYV